MARVGHACLCLPPLSSVVLVLLTVRMWRRRTFVRRSARGGLVLARNELEECSVGSGLVPVGVGRGFFVGTSLIKGAGLLDERCFLAVGFRMLVTRALRDLCTAGSIRCIGHWCQMVLHWHRWCVHRS